MRGRLALALALVFVGCAEKTADLQLNAADQAVQAAAERRAGDCAPEVLKAAEEALAEARLLASDGDVDEARSKASQAETLARQARAASPPGCDEAEAAATEASAASEAGMEGRPGAGAEAAGREALTRRDLEEVLDTVYFDFNQAVIRDDSKAVLSEVAEVLRALPAASLEIEGHCDVRGSTEYNLHLGERRARAVMKYLVTQGVDPDQLRVISYGEERPADFGFGEAAHARNRRAELRAP